MIVKELRKFLAENDIDYLLINTCDEYLLEYNELSRMARYHATNFSGSTGDALLSKDKLYLFVDSRYYEQADLEVDSKVVSVVRVSAELRYLKALIDKIEPNKTLAIVSAKTSINFYFKLVDLLKDKKINIKKLDFDPVFKFAPKPKSVRATELRQVPTKIAGKSARQKIKELQSQIKKDENILITGLEDIAYYTNLRSDIIPNSSCFKSKFLITQKDATLFVKDKIPCKVDFDVKKISDFCKDDFSKGKFYLDKESINLSDFDKVKDYSFDLDFTSQKSVKTNEEIEYMKDCFKRTDNVVNKIRDIVNSDKKTNEKDLCLAVVKYFIKNGAFNLSFNTILAAGKNSSIVHYSKSSKENTVNDGDFVLLDCGGYFQGGYATDITRTFVKGEPDELQKKVYTIVLKAFLNTYHYSSKRPITGYKLDSIARKIIEENKPDGFIFGHGTGHGVGISVHEFPPTISPSPLAKSPLKENMCFTIEPGMYKENWGGVRLENSVYLTKEDEKYMVKSFSHVPFEEKAIDYTLLTKKEQKWLKEWQEG